MCVRGGKSLSLSVNAGVVAKGGTDVSLDMRVLGTHQVVPKTHKSTETLAPSPWHNSGVHDKGKGKLFYPSWI